MLWNFDESGLHCSRGDFYVDPVRPVRRAIFTGEHRRIAGVAEEISTEAPTRLGDVALSFHPSGFAPGTVQVRVEADLVWVVTGDWKRDADPLCAPFEVVRCDGLVTTADFALPIFRWDSVEEIGAWLDAHEACALFASPVLALRLHAQLGRPLRLHDSLEPLAEEYARRGVVLPASDPSSKRLLAAPSARAGLKLPKGAVTALAAGTARIRGTRRRSNYDTGFAVSEHPDWPAILNTVTETGARQVLVTRGHPEPLARFLREERGLDARALP